MADFGYNNCYQKPTKFKPIADVTVTDSGMIALTDEPLPCGKTEKE